MTTIVKCPTCNKPVPWSEESPYRPFCCERCRLIDLGAWASEQHRIPADIPEDFPELNMPNEETNS